LRTTGVEEDSQLLSGLGTPDNPAQSI